MQPLVGFQRALLAKGARSVLVSLWSVDDRATEALTDAFFREWLGGSGVTRAEALRRAQREVQSTPGWEDPRFWAAFQLSGAQ